MTSLTTDGISSNPVIEIGGLPIRLYTEDPDFIGMLAERYTGFVTSGGRAKIQFEVQLSPPDVMVGHGDVRVECESGQWLIGRGDFDAEWNPVAARGVIRQSVNPYSLNSVLRIVHSLVLAEQGGFLVHAASAVRNGRAFLFAGVSGAGKTTISRLAPPDATLLTDEISYVARHGSGYYAYGTPFAGDLGRIGENISAPLAAIYLLAKGHENRIEDVSASEAVRALLENVLFFANDSALVRSVFEAACDLTTRVPVQRLTFQPSTEVWELIV